MSTIRRGGAEVDGVREDPRAEAEKGAAEAGLDAVDAGAWYGKVGIEEGSLLQEAAVADDSDEGGARQVDLEVAGAEGGLRTHREGVAFIGDEGEPEA